MLAEGKVGPVAGAAQAQQSLRLDKTGALVTAHGHGRYMEAALQGLLYSTGSTALTAINAATYTVTTLGATCTPIIGIWNPLSNTVNLVLAQAVLGITITNLTSTGPGPFVWAAATGQSAISTGSTPISRRTLTTGASAAKGFFGGTALTGLSGNLTVIGASAIYGGSAMNISFVGTAVGMPGPQVTNTEVLEGGFIVPPGGVLALLATTNAVAHSVVSGMVWEETPV
jgi:hypothetical protein